LALISRYVNYEKPKCKIFRISFFESAKDCISKYIRVRRNFCEIILNIKIFLFISECVLSRMIDFVLISHLPLCVQTYVHIYIYIYIDACAVKPIKHEFHADDCFTNRTRRKSRRESRLYTEGCRVAFRYLG